MVTKAFGNSNEMITVYVAAKRSQSVSYYPITTKENLFAILVLWTASYLKNGGGGALQEKTLFGAFEKLFWRVSWEVADMHCILETIHKNAS